MKPILVFASCGCVSKTQVSIQSLEQLSFDGEYIHFQMTCLMCSTTCLIAEPFENYADLKGCEEEVMLFMDSEESKVYFELCLTGRTYCKSPKYKPPKKEV